MFHGTHDWSVPFEATRHTGAPAAAPATLPGCPAAGFGITSSALLILSTLKKLSFVLEKSTVFR